MQKLAIWPICNAKDEFKNPLDGLLFPKNICVSSSESCYIKRAQKPFLSYKDAKERSILEELGADVLGLYDFVGHYVKFPSKLEGKYIDFIKSILRSPNFGEVEMWISNNRVIPNRFGENLKRARDLYDYGVELFQITFGNSEKFCITNFNQMRGV